MSDNFKSRIMAIYKIEALKKNQHSPIPQPIFLRAQIQVVSNTPGAEVNEKGCVRGCRAVRR